MAMPIPSFIPLINLPKWFPINRELLHFHQLHGHFPGPKKYAK
jgi:hypothetical protein